MAFGVKKLFEPTTFPLPAWLAGDLTHLGGTGPAMFAAAQRINFAKIVDGAKTVVTGKDSVGSVEKALRSADSKLSIVAGPSYLTLELSGIAIEKKGIRNCIDWELTCAVDGGDLVIAPTAAVTIGGEVANQKQFLLLKAALAEALTRPPTLTPPIPVAQAWEHLAFTEAHTPVPPLGGHALPRSATISTSTAEALDLLAETGVPAPLRERLAEQGAWPLWVPDGSAVQVNATTELALRVVGTLMLQLGAMDQGTLGQDALDALRSMKVPEPDSPVCLEPVAVHRLDRSSRFLPFRVGGLSNGSVSVTLPMSLWPCGARVDQVHFGRKAAGTDRYCVSRPGIGEAAHIEFGPALSSPAFGYQFERRLGHSSWALSGGNGATVGDLLETDFFVCGLGFDAGDDAIHNSDALLAWLWNAPAMFEPPTGDGGGLVSMVDRLDAVNTSAVPARAVAAPPAVPAPLEPAAAEPAAPPPPPPPPAPVQPSQPVHAVEEAEPVESASWWLELGSENGDGAGAPEPASASVPTVEFDEATSLAVRGVLVIGRDPEGQEIFAIDDPGRSVSKSHLSVEPVDGQWRVSDLHSTNGVVVIGADGLIHEVPSGGDVLADAGSRVRFGQRELRLGPLS